MDDAAADAAACDQADDGEPARKKTALAGGPLRDDDMWSRADACAALRWMIDMAQADADAAGELGRNAITAITYAVRELNDIFDVRSAAGDGALSEIIAAVRGVDAVG